MAQLKTIETRESVISYINSIPDINTRNDCFEVVKIMKEMTKSEPKMWGKSIVGFGNYKYKYSSGREGEWFLMGFSPRKLNLTLYIMTGFEKHKDIMAKLGKYKTGKSCLYLKRLSDIDIKLLKELMKLSLKDLKAGKGFCGC